MPRSATGQFFYSRAKGILAHVGTEDSSADRVGEFRAGQIRLRLGRVLECPSPREGERDTERDYRGRRH